MADPTVALFWGEEPFLLREAAAAFFERHGVRPTEVGGREWEGGEMADLATPSLFGEGRALLVSDAHHLSEDGARQVRAYLDSPSPDAVLAFTAVSRGKAGPPLAKAVHAAGGLVQHLTIKRSDLPKWLADRAAGRGIRLSTAAASALQSTIGNELAVLDQAVGQLGVAFPGAPIGPEEVRAQFRGIGEQQVWDLCDHALSGRLPEALVALRSMLESRSDPLLILGGIVSRLRDLIRVRSLPERASGAEAAKAAGLRFEWQVRRYREQARRFSSPELEALHAQAADADRALKAGVPGDVVLALLVAAMTGERGVALSEPIRVSR